MENRRSLSFDPYHAVSEVYTKEVTHRPIGPVSEFPPEILNILREKPRAPHSPPLVRSRENTWTQENFPIVRVPSAQFTDIMTELYDYHEVEKYTRRSVTPDFEPLRREPKIVEKAPLPTYQVIPPTPEKNTPRHPHGIPLTSPYTPEAPKKPLPMYEEYVKMQKENVENRNFPVPRPRSKSPLVTSSDSESNRANNNNLRHIDSSSESSEASEAPKINSEDVVKPEDVGKRYVYSHDVYVDSTTGRPFTPGREDLREKKNCDKLKINVYFKPPHPPVEVTYKLDEIEIEKQEEILLPKLRPLDNRILSRSASQNPSVPSSEIPVSTEISREEMESRRIPTRTTVLRKEHEIVTVPLGRNQVPRQSRIMEHGIRRSASKTITERSIPLHVAPGEDTSSINMDDIFPKMPHHQMVTDIRQYPPSRSSTRSHLTSGNIDKAERDHLHRRVAHLRPDTVEVPLTRGSSKTSSVKEEYRVKRPSERSPSFVSSQAPTVKSERTPSEVRIPVTVARAASKRISPEELDYGKFQNGKPDDGQVKDLPYTRGISKTPSDKDYRIHEKKYSNPTVVPPYPKEVHIPYQEKIFQHEKPKSIPSARSSYRSHQTGPKSETPELPYTRGPSKTPSVKEVHIPYNNPEKERAYQQAAQQQPSPKRVPSGRTRSPPPRRAQSPGANATKSRPSTQGPFEEIVHIKERYERDETIRRFFPTTTTV